MGNPHLVFLVNSLEEIDLLKYGEKIEKNELFIDGINIEIVEIINKRKLKIKFWERDIKDFPDKEYSNSDIIINTSCEHLHQQTIYDTIDKLERGTLVVLQSNNYHKLQEHINTVKDLQEFVSQYQSRLINIEMYEKDFLEYKRFMILGLKR